MKITVREATIDDLELLFDIYAADGVLGDFPSLRDNLKNELASPSKRIVWITLSGSISVGTIALVQDHWQKDLADGKKRGLVKRLRVRIDYRGKHVSRFLHDALESRAREIGFDTLSIEVEKENTRAVDIYKYWGYQYLRDSLGGGELVLTKEL